MLDEQLRPMPDGEPGELHLGGTGLARGYLRRPRLTATKFVRHPFTDDPEARLYKTGDLVRRRADGVLEFLDRTDDQVKIRGVRVEPGEVAAALERHPNVAASAVLAEEGPEGTRLVAYVARRPERGLELRELYGHLRESLPISLLPAEIVPLDLDRWPLSPSGKVDRKALREAACSGKVNGHCGGRERVEPRDATEYRLAKIWADVLEGRPVGMTDDFFEAGGDSLAAIDLLARVERTFGRTVTIGEWVGSPTVEGLARVLRRTDPAEWSPLVPLRATGSGRPLFCIHPGGGGVLCYVELARAVGPDRPVYALQAPGVDGVRPPLKTVEKMAAEYVAAIRTFRPTGPYDLCGWSFGAVVAYEMARRLRAEGHEVSSLTLIDGGFLYSFAVLRALLPKEFLLAPVWTDRERLTAPFREFADRAGIVPPGASEAQAAHALDVFLANVAALMDYRPEPYVGRATLLLGDERLETGRHDPVVEWGRLCEVDVHRVPGGHLTLLRPPFVEAVAARVGRSVVSSRFSVA